MHNRFFLFTRPTHSHGGRELSSVVCSSVLTSVPTKSRKIKQTSSENTNHYWRDCRSGKVDHWCRYAYLLHFCFQRITTAFDLLMPSSAYFLLLPNRIFIFLLLCRTQIWTLKLHYRLFILSFLFYSNVRRNTLFNSTRCQCREFNFFFFEMFPVGLH